MENSKAQQLTAQMTLEEKISMVMGKGFWITQNIDRLGIPSMRVSDGPSGLRMQQGGEDHMGIHESVQATGFPCGTSVGSTWDRDLVYEMGKALGRECRHFGVDMLLGPAINIKRHPLNGRNFEYFSEDPYLTAELAKAYVNGVQRTGVGACIKHFAANNQEHNRNCVDTIVDERTLREIYLYAFEACVKDSKPWSVMSAYNKLNGLYCGHQPWLLKTVLRNEWNFQGFVVSDWGGTNDAGTAHSAGLDLEMPCGGPGSIASVQAALDQGILTETELDQSVERIVKASLRAEESRNKLTDRSVDWEAHHKIAYQVAVQGAVLLKNEDNILPINPEKRVAVIGALAVDGGNRMSGSAIVNSKNPTVCIKEIQNLVGSSKNIYYAPGYEDGRDIVHDALIEEAVSIAQKADVAVIFVGVSDGVDAEGKDRDSLSLNPAHEALITACARVQKNIVVILNCGGVVEMPWIGQVKAVLNMHLAGEAAGAAAAALIYGKENPCGRLAESYPLCLEQTPAYFAFPDIDKRVTYTEGIFIGYRYYDTRRLDVLFPFGYGLSYTTFEYSQMRLDKEDITDEDLLNVSVSVKNTGQRAGSEVIQLYVHDEKSSVRKAEKELKSFEKVYLEPGEEKNVTMTLDSRAFAYYDIKKGEWIVEGGKFTIMIGASSRDIRLSQSVGVYPVHPLPLEFTRTTCVKEMYDNERSAPVIRSIMDELLPNILFFGDEMPLERKRFFLMMSSLEMMQRFNPEVLTEEKVNDILDQVNHAGFVR